jgi:hypothetical protein
MSTLPLVAVAPCTLADVVGETLDDALACGAARCMWCGAEATAAVADRWTGRVVVRCPECGSELEGTGVRHGRELRV